MQTFLPYRNFSMSARALDNKRLGKQRVEAKQILLALRDPENRWRNHPAVKQWRGYEGKLALYGARMCTEWLRRGFQDSLRPWFMTQWLLSSDRSQRDPPWLGCEKYHASHRSNLKRKDPEYYEHFEEPPILAYYWPSKEQNVHNG